MKFSIIIPCYNEYENIDFLIQRIRGLQEKYDLEYILVEKGSKDKSREDFEENVDRKYANIKVVYVNQNRGYGYGLQQGMKKAIGEYVGWIHADLQMPPEELVVFFEKVNSSKLDEKLFLKGIRTNRSAFDIFFTNGQALFNSILFSRILYDIGAIPVLFHRSLLTNIDKMPNDFSIELYIYKEALEQHFKIERYKVKLMNRKTGESSWNNGFKSKIRQSVRIFKDSIKIKKGEKVL